MQLEGQACWVCLPESRMARLHLAGSVAAVEVLQLEANCSAVVMELAVGWVTVAGHLKAPRHHGLSTKLRNKECKVAETGAAMGRKRVA